MKKIRVFLAISAVLLAVGGAFASYFVPQPVGYEYKVIDGDEFCISHTIECNTTSATPCTVSGVAIQLREVSTTSNDCGANLFKN